MKNFIFATILLFVLISCGGTRTAATYSSDNSNEITTYQKEGKELQNSNSRILIYNAELTLITDKRDSVMNDIINISMQYSGYQVSASKHHISIRVKSSMLNEALKSISKLGKVKDQNVFSNDITEVYNDNEIRLENAEKSRQRYLELLAKAENVETVLKVEKELERLNTEIAILKNNKKNYDLEICI